MDTLRPACALAVFALLMLGTPAESSAIASQDLEARSALERADDLLAAVRTGDARTILERAWDLEPQAVPDSGGAPGTERLLAAVALAEELRARSLAGADPAAIEAVLAAPWMETPTAPPAMSRGLYAGPGGGAPTPNPRFAELAGSVDLSLLAQAELVLIDALESSLPALEGLLPGASVPLAASLCGATGDMVLESPDCRLMVGNTGPNGYGPGVDPLVLIDLGGDDTYTNGAANAVGGVRLLVDLGGNDAYTVAAAGAAAGVAATAQGIATASTGVALLADLGGDDAYVATADTAAPQPGPAAGTATVTSQAAARLGAAVLLEAGGDDAFRAASNSSGGLATAFGQGAAALGLAALVNLDAFDGAADDTYDLTASSTLHQISQTPQFSQFQVGPADTQGQGAGQLAGVGAFVETGGDDEVSARSDGGVALFVGQGAAVGGAGVVVDGLGNDIYTAIAAGDTTLSLITTDPSVCWNLNVQVVTGETRALGQGATTLGAGLLVDGTGDDVRALQASGHAGAVAEARSNFDCSAFGGNRATATAASGPGTAIGQGSGASGLGILIDAVGNDFNSLAGESQARARAIALSPGPDLETATPTAGAGETRGQGHSATGVGLLADALGIDTYTSTARSEAIRETSAGILSTLGPRVQSVQGFGNGGLGWLLELDGLDTYSTDPTGASAAANNACWSNGPNGGRGRDLQLGALLPSGCP
jgi:hypothetical protein